MTTEDQHGNPHDGRGRFAAKDVIDQPDGTGTPLGSAWMETRSARLDSQIAPVVDVVDQIAREQRNDLTEDLEAYWSDDPNRGRDYIQVTHGPETLFVDPRRGEPRLVRRGGRPGVRVPARQSFRLRRIPARVRPERALTLGPILGLRPTGPS